MLAGKDAHEFTGRHGRFQERIVDGLTGKVLDTNVLGRVFDPPDQEQPAADSQDAKGTPVEVVVKLGVVFFERLKKLVSSPLFFLLLILY
jgi:hypothetical protein